MDENDLEPVTFGLDGRILGCVECGEVTSCRAEGWRLAIDCDDELQAFCPECWTAEFEGG